MKQLLRVFFATVLSLLAGFSMAFATGYLYVNNNTATNTVSGYRVNGDGTLTLLPGFPLATGGNGFNSPTSEDAAARIHVNGPYLYVANTSSANISAFIIQNDGSLVAVAGQPFPTGSTNAPLTLAVHPSGKFLICGNSDPLNDLSVFSIAADGSLSAVAGSPFACSTGPYSSAFTPDGKFLFAGGAGGASNQTISVYSFDDFTGALTEVSGSPFAIDGLFPVGYSVSPNGQRLFSAVYGSNQIGVFDINPTTGALSPISGSPFASGLTRQPIDSVLDPSGNRLFVVARSGKTANIGVYDIAASGVPAAVAGSPFSSGGWTADVVVIDKAGHFLFVANSEAQNVSAFAINAQTGALSAVAGSPFATNAQGGFIGGMALYESPAPVPALSANGLAVFALVLVASMFLVLRRKSRCA
jgi:6-phosphogluconolactonase